VNLNSNLGNIGDMHENGNGFEISNGNAYKRILVLLVLVAVCLILTLPITRSFEFAKGKWN
jgi:hypothetical protein